MISCKPLLSDAPPIGKTSDKLADGSVAAVDYDQGVRPDSAIEKVRSLPPLYKPDGTISAASASGESDGAAAAVLMSKEKARELGVELDPLVGRQQ